MAATRLTDAEIAAALGTLEGWTQDGEAITKDFLFDDFAAAFDWMSHVALAAEEADHHPEWTNVYNRVQVRLRTHDAGGLTGLDFALAAVMDRLKNRSSGDKR